MFYLELSHYIKKFPVQRMSLYPVKCLELLDLEQLWHFQFPFSPLACHRTLHERFARKDTVGNNSLCIEAIQCCQIVTRF